MNKHKELSQKDLIEEIKKFQKEILILKKRKKYGLVWENKPEKFDKESKNALPVLREKGGKFKNVISDQEQGFNILIEGDNYHSLSVLNYTHRGKIDVIYIDPPYNTGSTEWKYNNNYLDKDNAFRHSKWLSFMEKRIKLAKNLLTNDGILICTIDENERAPLELLLQELFLNYKIVAVTVVHNPQGIQGNNFSYTHEYALFVFKDVKDRINKVKVEERREGLRDDTGNSFLRTDAKNCFYPIFIRENKIIGFGDIPNNNFHPTDRVIKKDKYTEIWPLRDGVERKWRYAKKSIEKISKSLFLKETKRGIDVFQIKNTGKPKTVWIDPKYHAGGKYGTKLVEEIIGRGKFNFPKSLYSVIDTLKIASSKNSLILDFFAGSGTTGHAVLNLNKEDGGNRKFILCTNNELNGVGSELAKKNLSINKDKFGISQRVTFPRLKKVIKGYKKITNRESVKGLGGNIKYLKTDFIKISESIDDLKEKIVEASTEILCLKENSFNKVFDNYNKNRIKIFENKNKYIAILFDLFYFDDFVSELENLVDKKVSVYIFSYTRDFDKEEFGDLGQKINFSVEAIPEKILETYQKIFNF